MYKSDLVDLEENEYSNPEPSFSIEPDEWLELDLISQCID